MRHRKTVKKLGRTASHRRATLAALANALIKHKRIQTTLAKAKALRMFIEPLITRAKNDTTHNRRQVFRHLQDKESIKILFGEIAEKVAGRNGGYTRVVKLGQRAGDGAEMAVIELVDYNVMAGEETGTKRRRRTRRGGRRGKGASKPTAALSTEPVAEEEAKATPQEDVSEAASSADVAPDVTSEVEASEPPAESGEEKKDTSSEEA